jgi:transcriptional regulator with XRE-family HTH domain
MDLRIGEKIKALRLGSELTQAELADRAQLTKGFISQLENDQTSISVDSLADILDALGVSLGDFFSDGADLPVVFLPDDRISVENKGASQFELLIPGSTNNIMDPILITLKPGERLDRQGPLPGEQFGFVLQGEASLLVDRKEHTVPAEHCFYFSSGLVHQIRNESNKTTRLLWVTSPPLM